MRDALTSGRKRGANPLNLIDSLSDKQIRYLLDVWEENGRDEQLPPRGDWLVWLMLGGRGAGKTRAGAEWVRAMALGEPPFAADPVGPIALVGETLADVREVMVEGPSGVLSVHGRDKRPVWLPSRRRLEWPNGMTAHAFSSEDPESLRGPQFAAAWSDELAKWKHAEATWDMLQFGLRLGDRPRQVVTTTPRPIPLLRQLLDADGTVRTHAATYANRLNLAPGFLDRVVGRYAGTRLGRQELEGELIADRVDALWQREAIETGRVDSAPTLGRIVVAVDPPASARSGVCGIVAAGLGRDGTGYVLADATVQAARPDRWAGAALNLYRRLDADALVAEVNQGGDMVAAVIAQVDANVPVTTVRATRGKWVRAEPVAALYAQGRVRHAGTLRALEDQLCDFGPDGLSQGRSPDRLDAMVWAITALMLTRGEPRVRGV
ncbi:DNA-packaging protein [Bauldia sp.]|uniref:DNA-packaging protein n=1 Tax=Bauldia sp. TaxID=2575872 RepID=UPI003BA87190